MRMRSARAIASTPTATSAFFSAHKLESYSRKIRPAEITQRQSAAANVSSLRGRGQIKVEGDSDDSRVCGHRSDGAAVSLAHLHLDVGEAAPACAEIDRDQG